MSDRPTITQQYSFSVGEDGETDGIEPSEESVETSLETFGADVDHRECDTRIDQPEATTFGVDDRATVTRGDGGEQHALFVDTDDDQQTLTGERAASQCLFENDEQDDDRADTASDEPTLRAVADGGRVKDDETDTEDADASEKVMVAIPRKDLAGVADALDAESETIERSAGEGPRTETLARLVEECRIGLSLLAINDETATIRRTTAAAAADELQAAVKTETGEYAEELQELVGVLRQALDEQPTSGGFEDNHNDEGDESTDTDEQDDDREDDHAEDPDESPDVAEDTTFDPDAETVTEAWEGAFLSASWGYEQTNVELAQITDVSESGKTVLARLVVAERVGHGQNSTHIRPTAEQYGDKFRLHVRSVRSDPAFRGSYPLNNDGDMDNGPTRRESFYPFDNDLENSVRRTATNHGH